MSIVVIQYFFSGGQGPWGANGELDAVSRVAYREAHASSLQGPTRAGKPASVASRFPFALPKVCAEPCKIHIECPTMSLLVVGFRELQTHLNLHSPV